MLSFRIVEGLFHTHGAAEFTSDQVRHPVQDLNRVEPEETFQTIAACTNLKLLAGCNEPTTEQIIGQLGLLASAPAKSGKNAFGSDWHIRLHPSLFTADNLCVDNCVGYVDV
jgi:hypothetical protein